MQNNYSNWIFCWKLDIGSWKLLRNKNDFFRNLKLC